MKIKNCIRCEGKFAPHTANQKNCVTCLEKYDRRYTGSRLSGTCKGCGEEFKKISPRQFYCSPQCVEENQGLRKRYGITRKDWNNMYEAQDRVCAICSGEGGGVKHAKYKLCVDHCHQTGKVRGLLCHKCNAALGLFKDNTHTISKAINYLEGATTIEKSSTPKQVEAQSKGLKPLDDIV